MTTNANVIVKKENGLTVIAPGFFVLSISLFELCWQKFSWTLEYKYWGIPELVFLVLTVVTLVLSNRSNGHILAEVIWLLVIWLLLLSRNFFLASPLMTTFICFTVAEWLDLGRDPESLVINVYGKDLVGMFSITVSLCFQYVFGKGMVGNVLTILPAFFTAVYVCIGKDVWNRNFQHMLLVLSMVAMICEQNSLLMPLLTWWILINGGMFVNKYFQMLVIPEFKTAEKSVELKK